jgi:hypothetical protein
MFGLFVAPFLIILGVLLGVLTAVFLIAGLMGKKPVASHLLFLFSTAVGFSFLGLTVGIFVGNSRESAVNTTISASMTFLGGMIVYLFTKKDSSTVNFSLKLNNSFIIAIICLITFPVSLLYGAIQGGINRRATEEYDKSVEINNQMLLKNNEYSLQATEDSIKTFLEIYRDTVRKK